MEELIIMPQVDPDYMRTVFEDELGKLSFYSEEDHLALWKNDLSDLRFQYSSANRSFVWCNGAIHAEEPREGFGDVDLISYMKVDMLSPDEDGELLEAVSRIVERACIERVVAYAGLGVQPEDVQRLSEMRGRRLLEHLEYGLGPP